MMRRTSLSRPTVSLEESMYRIFAHRALGAALSLILVSASATPSLAGVCFTSGKVYVQQKVWDKAAATLECARKQEPQNLQVYLLLGTARSELTQYASAGAAFTLGIQAAKAKKDEKKVEDLRNNQKFYLSRLYNLGVSALQLVTSTDAVAEEQASSSKFAGPAAAEVAITDTLAYGKYDGSSRLEEAAYYFRLATLVDPTAVDAYRNLSYVYELMGRTDDAIAAARAGLALSPNDAKLAMNLKAAAVGRANRLYKAGKFLEAVAAYREAIVNDPASKLLYQSRIASAFYEHATAMGEKDPLRAAMLDSAAVAYSELLRDTPADSTAIRENAFYNRAVIYSNQGKNKEAVVVLDEAVAAFPKSKDLLSLAGQTKFNSNDYAGAVTVLRQAVALDPKDPTLHQFLFLSLNKLNKQAESVGEYSMYKALSDGKKREGSEVKIWVDAADIRYGPRHQLKKTLTTEGGYPDEVRTFMDGDKSVESWFYWNKGKMIAFMDGQVLSQTTFPPAKS